MKYYKLVIKGIHLFIRCLFFACVTTQTKAVKFIFILKVEKILP